MTDIGDLQYEIRCAVCGKRFFMGKVDDLIPKHAPRGTRVQSWQSYTPCAGSNKKGRPINVQVKKAPQPNNKS